MTTTEEWLTLSDWLREQGCTPLAFEATGGYGKPIFTLLEGRVERVVVTAQQSKAVPGRKTERRDAEWIADLLRHGLLKASFIPSHPQRELRDLTRSRVRLTEEKAREVNRVQKTLEETNLKGGDVVSDSMGKASRTILPALADGETDPSRFAVLAVGRVRAWHEPLEAALKGQVTDPHRFLLREHLTHIRHREQASDRVTAEITRRFTPPSPREPPCSTETEERGTPDSASGCAVQLEVSSCKPAALTWAQAVVLRCRIPGISERNAIGIVAEIGTTRQQFPTAAHFASWAGICPGNQERAGKRLSGKTRKGNPW
jgi:transposase